MSRANLNPGLDSLGIRHKRVLVIGGGRCGLAVGAALAARGLAPQQDFVLIDQPETALERIARRAHQEAFPRHWQLPRVTGLGVAERSADESQASYLEVYADQLGLKPIKEIEVHRIAVEPPNHRLVLETDLGRVETRNIVIASDYLWARSYVKADDWSPANSPTPTGFTENHHGVPVPGLFTAMLSQNRPLLIRHNLASTAKRIARQIASRP